MEDSQHLDSSAPAARFARSNARGAVEPEGRPFDDLQVKRILDALEDGATYKIAANVAGVHPSTFRRWRAKYDDLRRAVDRAEAEAASEALAVVRYAASEGDWRAASWLLEKRMGYHKQRDVPAAELRRLTDAVKGVIQSKLTKDDAQELIIAIGDELAEAQS